ncbi:hypothetical protein EPN96_05635 [bacterium]|nr:MAG: hypothetical protein EPN96_05635 [bacterium]
MTGIKTNSGASLNKKWKVGAKHALYHKEGKWFMPLELFPGAYFDQFGYVLFQKKEDYLNCKQLSIRERVNVRGGISGLPSYKTFN